MHHTTALIARRRAQSRREEVAGRALPVFAQRLALALGLVLFVGLIVLGLKSLAGDPPAPKRQIAKIAVLPDTPPPPPPPPPKEQKPEPPKPEQRPQPQAEQVDKPPPAPANEPIKMEGAAGTGPSAFAAGSVTQDYRGGTPTVGGTAASAPSVADRAQERLYAGTVRQMLRDEIERQLSPEAGELTASFALWVAGDGRISKWEFDGGTVPPRAELLKTALDRSAETLRLPAPPALTLPMRFRLTLRPGG